MNKEQTKNENKIMEKMYITNQLTNAKIKINVRAHTDTDTSIRRHKFIIHLTCIVFLYYLFVQKKNENENIQWDFSINIFSKIKNLY